MTWTGNGRGFLLAAREGLLAGCAATWEINEKKGRKDEMANTKKNFILQLRRLNKLIIQRNAGERAAKTHNEQTQVHLYTPGPCG